MILFQLLFVLAAPIYASSSNITEYEGEGYEEVSDIAAHLANYAPEWDEAWDADFDIEEEEDWDDDDLYDDEEWDEAWGQDLNMTSEEGAEDYMYDEDPDEYFDEAFDEDYEISNSTGNLRGRMSARDRQWLASHNKRRKKYHRKFRKPYKALKWSPGLKASSKRWAQHLASLCGRRKIYHDPRNKFGENLASNMGTGSWGAKPSTDKVLTRLVEKEANWGFPRNGHYTQVLWRATRYVGCAEHTKVFNGGKKRCHVQVCRYARPGNCNMGKYKSYRTPMLANSSPCKPSCPPGGCK